MDAEDLYNTLIAFYKDHITAKQLQELKQSTIRVLEAEVDARRAKKRELVQAVISLRMSLQKFEYTYSLIKDECGSSSEVEHYIQKVNREINDLLRQKNSHLI